MIFLNLFDLSIFLFSKSCQKKKKTKAHKFPWITELGFGDSQCKENKAPIPKHPFFSLELFINGGVTNNIYLLFIPLVFLSFTNQQQTMGSSSSDVEAGFAKLQGEDFEYYMQTYSIILGRNSKKSTVDVDLSSLGGGMNISRHHARIFYDFQRRRFALEVLGKNGCFVEGVLHLPGNVPVKLDSQDLLQIGDKEFYFLLPVRSILGGPIGPRHQLSYQGQVGVGPGRVPGVGYGGGKKGGRYVEEEYEEGGDEGGGVIGSKKMRRGDGGGGGGGDVYGGYGGGSGSKSALSGQLGEYWFLFFFPVVGWFYWFVEIDDTKY